MPMNDNPDNAASLDARGLMCPEPLMLLRNRVREMSDGDEIEVLATDPTTIRDFTDYCRFMKHQLIEQRHQGDTFYFRIRKGAA